MDSSPGGRIIFKGFLVMMLVLLWPLFLSAAELLPFEEKELLNFSGTGTSNTRPFTVEGEWEVHWQSSGLIIASLHTKDGKLVEMPINSVAGGKGKSYFPNGGEYYFKVNASQDWTITIVDLVPAPSQ